MLKYSLGEMKSIDGSALRYEAQAKLLAYTLRISEKIVSSSLYKVVLEKIPSERVLLYLQSIIKTEIRPFIYKGYAMQWYKRNNKKLPFTDKAIKVPRMGVFPLLKEFWDLKDVPIRLVDVVTIDVMCDPLCRRYIKLFIKKYVEKLYVFFNRSKRVNASTKNVTTDGMIACHYNEGIDFSRRNDLNWFEGSAINPERLLIYFDHLYLTPPSATVRGLVKKEIVQQINQLGFRWLALKKNVIETQGSNYWLPPRLPKNYIFKRREAKTQFEKWLVDVANGLLRQVHYWRSFYEAFNIRINYIPEDGLAENIVQAIAFDVKEESPGVLVGKQRTELYPLDSTGIGFYPKHIFFVWSKRTGYYIKANYDMIKVLIVSGYPNDVIGRWRNPNQQISQKARAKGAQFVIALFDNSFGSFSPVSKKEITQFYRTFLQWVIDDASVGLVIKSKKPFVIDGLKSIQPLLERALKTGRCIRVGDVINRFPAEASAGSDMAIGIGISSALIEAVIAGSKGILYDATNCKDYEIYDWGRDVVIFNTLENLMLALKGYKDNPDSNPKLGDWTNHLAELDPFRDGKGGERIGIYLRWLLEGFDAGKNQDEAIKYANELYAKNWGRDKVIIIENRDRKQKV